MSSESAAATSEAAGVLRPSRDESFDIAKGVGIVAVVTLHLTSRSARLFHQEFGLSWWSLQAINRWVNFCVPLFLIVSAILMARSVARQERPDWKVFAHKRLKSIFIPLLLWSVIYWVIRGVLRGPSFFTSWKAHLIELLFGKAEFHLYFLAVLLQLCAILPLCVMLLRRIRFNIWTVTLFAILCQAGAFWLQKQVRVPFPASTVFWYSYAILPAIWIGLNWDKWPQVRRVAWPLWLVFATAGLSMFSYQSFLAFMQFKRNGDFENASVEAYALGASLLILTGLTLWRSGFDSVRKHFRRLGEMSLQIYLMHPILLNVLSRGRIVNVFQQLPLPSLWLFLATLYGTYAIALLLDRVPYVNTVLFARPPAKKEGPSVASGPAPA